MKRISFQALKYFTHFFYNYYMIKKITTLVSI